MNAIEKALSDIKQWVITARKRRNLWSVTLGEESERRVEVMRVREGLASKRDVLREALRLYEYASEQSQKGPVELVVKEGDIHSTRYQIFAKKAA